MPLLRLGSIGTSKCRSMWVVYEMIFGRILANVNGESLDPIESCKKISKEKYGPIPIPAGPPSANGFSKKKAGC